MSTTENSERGQPLAVPLERPVRPLLERLRERRMLASTAALPGYGRANAAPVWVTSDPDPECHEAADEIERLRADRDSWAQQAADRAQDALDLVAAERERGAHALDGWRVLQALTPEQRKRIGYSDVSDVLDAVARLSRA